MYAESSVMTVNGMSITPMLCFVGTVLTSTAAPITSPIMIADGARTYQLERARKGARILFNTNLA